MTRVRADDYEAKKKAILDKAAALIARKGFDQATMLDVANACGASKSHIYHYFPSKEDLLYAIVHDHITRQAAELVRIVQTPQPAEDRFNQFIESFVRGAARERDEHIILMNDLKYLQRAQLREIRALEVRMTELLEGLLSELNPELMQAQRVRKPYALLLYGMMIWTFSWYRRTGDIGPQELAERIAHLFVHGFKAPPLQLAAGTPAKAVRSRT
ncbi:TetR/AcrR family transcriptional regulator [Ramlibacter tataouinensis]|uniref:TetR/AcrR family transcriptional regulator n=1 Tax=Ramlibacter tataouinensis TaxID=94132 RepID=UPI0022F3FBC2|nr:TetR/AcrR family transcriptional regulator [Ramlibacter tataouinensis]WBY03048.1 TetR/AcrR family transcriptional regulator [Ramlibacter tataouinensis]